MSWDHFEFFAVLLEIVGDATVSLKLSNDNNYYIITFFVTEIVSQHENF